MHVPLQCVRSTGGFFLTNGAVLSSGVVFNLAASADEPGCMTKLKIAKPATIKSCFMRSSDRKRHLVVLGMPSWNSCKSEDANCSNQPMSNSTEAISQVSNTRNVRYLFHVTEESIARQPSLTLTYPAPFPFSRQVSLQIGSFARTMAPSICCNSDGPIGGRSAAKSPGAVHPAKL